MPARRLFAMVEDATGVESSILAHSALQALYLFHGEALGFDAVRLHQSGLWFRRETDRALVAGRWIVTEQSVNGSAVPSVVFEI